MALKRIETYSNYREFLKDYYKDAKARRPYFSHRYFSKKAGLKSHNLLGYVIKGERNLTGSTIAAFIRGLGLDEVDGKFFSALVRFNQAKSPEVKQSSLEQMRELLPKIKEWEVPAGYYAYYSNWYNVAIRELACLFDWRGDYLLLAKKVMPPIKKSQAKEAVQLLLDIGLLKKKGDGTYCQAEAHILSSSDVTATSVRNLNRQLINLGRDSIEGMEPALREVSSLSIGISQKGMELCKKELRLFKDRIKKIANDDSDPDRVYNVNIQMFPLSAGVNE